MPPSARQQKRMKPYTRLPDPDEAVKGDGKPGGDGELGHNARDNDEGSWEDGSARWTKDGVQYVKDAETGKVTKEGELRQKRRRRMQEEAPAFRR